MPYYGNPNTLAAGLESITTMKDPTVLAAYIAQVDGFVTPEMEGHFYAIYNTAWPVADDTDKNAHSLLWHCGMLMWAYRFKGSANTLGVVPALAEDATTKWAETLDGIKSGKIVVPGTSRKSFAPAVSNARNPSFVPVPPEMVVQKSIADLYMRGLRT